MLTKPLSGVPIRAGPRILLPVCIDGWDGRTGGPE